MKLTFSSGDIPGLLRGPRNQYTLSLIQSHFQMKVGTGKNVCLKANRYGISIVEVTEKKPLNKVNSTEVCTVTYLLFAILASI